MKGKIKSFVVPGVYALSLILFVFSMYFVQKILNNTLLKEKDIINDEVEYVDGEIVENNDYLPVVETKETIVKPFVDSSVKIAKDYYDYMGEADRQENAIIFYENTYMQNSGVDYYSENSFDVVSILDGTVIDIKEDGVFGSIIEIRHTNELISVYQGLGEVAVKLDDKVVQGQVVGKSGKSNLNVDVENGLHFELYYMGQVVNPSDYYDKSLTDL